MDEEKEELNLKKKIQQTKAEIADGKILKADYFYAILNACEYLLNEDGLRNQNNINVKEHVLNDKIIHIKIGNDDYPAGPTDVENIEKLFTEKLKGINCRIIVTHHSVELTII